MSPLVVGFLLLCEFVPRAFARLSAFHLGGLHQIVQLVLSAIFCREILYEDVRVCTKYRLFGNLVSEEGYIEFKYSKWKRAHTQGLDGIN